MKVAVCGILLACWLWGASPVEEILRQRCESCHSQKVHTSGFSVDSLDAVIRGGNKHGRAVIAGHPESSPLVRLLKGELSPRMPIGGELPAAEVARIEQWIRALPPAPATTAGASGAGPIRSPCGMTRRRCAMRRG